MLAKHPYFFRRFLVQLSITGLWASSKGLTQNWSFKSKSPHHTEDI